MGRRSSSTTRTTRSGCDTCWRWRAATERRDGRLTAIIGTAGDRTDEALRELGRLAAEQTDRVIVKETRRYLRGRASVDEMTALYLEGVAAGGDTPHVVAADEPEALEIALRDLQPGDVVAMMCIETGPQSRARVEELGGVAKVTG